MPIKALLGRGPAVRDLLAVTQSQGINVAPKTIAETGRRFVGASNTDPAERDVALKFLDYKSFNNAVSRDVPNAAGEPSYELTFKWHSLRADEAAKMTCVRTAPEENAARFS